MEGIVTIQPVSYLMSPKGEIFTWTGTTSSHANTLIGNSPEHKDLFTNMVGKGVPEVKSMEYVLAVGISQGWVRSGILDLGNSETLFIECNNLDNAKKFLDTTNLEGKHGNVDRIAILQIGDKKYVDVPRDFNGRFSELL